MSVITLKKQFDEISEARGNDKQMVIEKYKDDKLFLDTLNFVFNPYIITGLAKKKIEKDLSASTYEAFSPLEEMFDWVKENNSGSDMAIMTVQSWILSQPTETHEFLKGVFTKDLQIGVSHKTINKVVGKDFIPEYSVQLAKKYEDEVDKVKGQFSISLKLDGIRCTVFNEESGPKFFSRKGLPIEGMTELEHEFRKLPTGTVYDGELLALNPKNLHSKDLFRLTQKLVRTDGEKLGLEFVAFDCLPIDEFHKGKSKNSYKQRFAILESLLPEEGFFNIRTVPVYYIGDDKDKIPEIMKHVTSEGYEGLMLNTLDGKYETKRTSNLLKVKQFQSADLRIIGFEEHRKQPGKLGALVVDYKGYKVNVGSGFTDDDRVSIWNNQDKLLGTIAEVQYFEESQNQSGGISLRFPVFLTLRDDKTKPSYN
jgi:DNA ligase-1